MRRREVVAGAMGLIVLLAVGCGTDDGEKTSAEPNQTSSTASSHVHAETPPPLPGARLVGSWYGKATLDEARLINKLESTPDPQQRQTIEAMAQIFLTTEIGAHFSADGQMGMEVEIRPGGQTIQDSTTGVWSIVSETETAIIIETREQLPSGGVETAQSRYQFVDGGAYALMVAPAAAELADCNPLFVFEKAFVGGQPSERVAAGAASAKQ